MGHYGTWYETAIRNSNPEQKNLLGMKLFEFPQSLKSLK